jgi:hypothetical protein
MTTMDDERFEQAMRDMRLQAMKPDDRKAAEANMTLQELQAYRDRLAEELKGLTETLADNAAEIDEPKYPEWEEDYIDQINDGDAEPFDARRDGSEFSAAANDFPIVLKQWQDAVNAVLRHTAKMKSNQPR